MRVFARPGGTAFASLRRLRRIRATPSEIAATPLAVTASASDGGFLQHRIFFRKFDPARLLHRRIAVFDAHLRQIFGDECTKLVLASSIPIRARINPCFSRTGDRMAAHESLDQRPLFDDRNRVNSMIRASSGAPIALATRAKQDGWMVRDQAALS